MPGLVCMCWLLIDRPLETHGECIALYVKHVGWSNWPCNRQTDMDINVLRRTHMAMTNWRIETAPHKHQQMSLLAVGAYSHTCVDYSHTHTSHRIQHSPIFYSDVGEFVSFFAVAVLLLFCRSRLALTDTSKWDDGRPVAVLYYLNRIELKSSRKYSTHSFKNLESDFVWARDFASWLLTWSDLTWRSSPSMWFEFGRLCVCIVCGHKSRISFACY